MWSLYDICFWSISDISDVDCCYEINSKIYFYRLLQWCFTKPSDCFGNPAPVGIHCILIIPHSNALYTAFYFLSFWVGRIHSSLFKEEVWVKSMTMSVRGGLLSSHACWVLACSLFFSFTLSVWDHMADFPLGYRTLLESTCVPLHWSFLQCDLSFQTACSTVISKARQLYKMATC